MIKFQCRCSNTFVVEDDQAGASLQCPKCGLLVDVPTLSDLPNLKSDGTYNLDELVERPEPSRLNTLYRSFTRDHVDPTTGLPIDLRLNADIDRLDRTVDPMQLKDEPKNVRPKYDPITGELVRELAVDGAGDDQPKPGAVPMARATVAYASAMVKSVPSAWAVALDLLMPINIAVMAFTSFAYLAGQFFMTIVVLFFLNLPLAALLLAHYGNVMEDTGPETRDELPRPLRHLDFADDLWKPFWRMFLSVLVCYAPAAWILLQGLPWEMATIVAGVGSLALPAVMLTMVTSGSIMNMRPDRVFGVIGLIGARYFFAVGIWLAALLLHLWLWIGVVLVQNYVQLGVLDAKWSVLFRPLAVYPLLAIAIYLMHYYCWYMGILYRRHQHEFPWVLQRHVPDTTRNVRTRAMPYGSIPRGTPGRRQFAPTL